MKVVSNTSPLIFLDNVNSLDLLSSCFEQVYIPLEVSAEFGRDKLLEVEVRPISLVGKNIVNSQFGILHQGELAAIQLAHEIEADLVLLDDLLARKKARRNNLNVMGTLGIFLTASYSGFISTRLAIEKIEILINKFNMFVAPNLLQTVKQELLEIEKSNVLKKLRDNIQKYNFEDTSSVD